MKDFKEIFMKSKELRKQIKHTRFRNKQKIKLSLIAEIIEFNEETESTHKTWKKKKFLKDKKLEEFADIIFLFFELIENSSNNELVDLILIEFEKWELIRNFVLSDELDLIELAIQEKYISAARVIIKIGITGIFSKKQVLKACKNKYLKNLERIGKEWN